MLYAQPRQAFWYKAAARSYRALVLIGATLLTACGSGGGSMGAAGTAAPQACTANCGGALVTLTDAPGAFISYIVNVVSLKLTRSDGTVVETLPVTTQVDFAQLVNLSEIISAAQVPAGEYVSASITLDYGSATIIVDNGTAGGVQITGSMLINGVTNAPLVAPNTEITLTLTLASGKPLVVAPGTIANLALDFNLADSNDVEPSLANPATVTVSGALTGSLVPDTVKQIRVRGMLGTVGANSFIINVRPFDNNSGANGQLTVQTTATTAYTIDGVSYVGTMGLTQLAGVPAGTMVAAYGTWDTTSQTFTASNVSVGSSVCGTKMDCVQGTVLSRSGNTLTVGNGLMLHWDQDRMHFARQVTVTVGAATAVSEQGQTGSFTDMDISVGQHAQFAGTSGTDAMGNPTLDASMTGGSALLVPTRVEGTVAMTIDNVVTLSLHSLDGRSPASFNFAGTGSGNDATAGAYTVALPAALSPTTVSMGAPVRFTGFVAPFGTAPPDFNATSLVSYANTQADLAVLWPPTGDATAFATLSATGMTIDQTALAASMVNQLKVGFETLKPSSLAGGLQLVPDPAATDPDFAIGHAMKWSNDSYTNFGDFTGALATDLSASGAAVVAVFARGPYSAATGVLSVDQIIVILNQ